ncbi:MAG: thioredoxin-disulfide reductase [Bacilli bacterium]|nr:thioredoxin-disulfide reductase [Bacilli bacterium]
MYDIIIIGAGPAGLTAALYARRANKKVLVLEASSYGGQILNASKVENYPGIESISGFDYATNLYNQVKKLDCEIKFETVVKIDEERNVYTNKNEYKTKTIIIATGSKSRKLKLENEGKLIGKGVSYCATCDGNFFKNKIVAVNGGGNTALEDAIYLSDIAKKVYLIHRRDEFRGENKYLTEINNKKNIEIILNSNIIKINGEEKLESIELENSNNEKQTLEIDGLFIAIGQEPKNEIFSNIIKLNDKGYIESEDGVHTNIKKIYVAGDARVKTLRQLTTAVSDGSIAATMAIKEMED